MRRYIIVLICLLSSLTGQGCKMEREMSTAHDLFAKDPLLLQAAEAVMLGDKSKLEALKRSGLNINREGKFDEDKTFSGLTLLNWAVINRDPKAMSFLLDEGADPNTVPQKNLTALSWAAKLEDQTIMALLLSRGADPNLYGSNGAPPIFAAASSDRWANVWFLLDHGANIDAIERITGNTLATRYIGRQDDKVYELLKRGASCTHLNYQGMGIAHSITYDRSDPEFPDYPYRQKIKQLLVSKGINLDVPRFGPPPRNEWPSDQKDDPRLIQAAKENAR